MLLLGFTGVGIATYMYKQKPPHFFYKYSFHLFF